MSTLNEHRLFNNPERVIEGWYWALRSDELKRKQAKAVSFLGRELVVFRGEDDKVIALDAYCPHMGAHLAEGKVEGNEIRCLFHHWKFNGQGACTDIPCQKTIPNVTRQASWPVGEKYGLIWIHAGLESAVQPQFGIPEVPELEGVETASRLGKPFVKECHPSVMMINAIDAQHFNSVHALPVELDFAVTERNESCIHFSNQTRMPTSNAFTRFAARFYEGPLTYILNYWFSSTGSVTVGPDFLHFHIIFALRPTLEGKSEGQTILVTRARPGFLGRLLTPVLLALTKIVGDYFAKGDTLIFKTIRFNFKTPIKADYSIIRFIQHAEKQASLAWGLKRDPSNEAALGSSEIARPASEAPLWQ